MLDRLRDQWLPRLCFTLTAGLALGLGLAVGGAAWLADAVDWPADLRRVVELFAADVLVRRTAVVCAAGLAVTAFVFFRPAPPKSPAKKKRPPARVHIPGA
jgi:hypothetical protein